MKPEDRPSPEHCMSYRLHAKDGGSVMVAPVTLNTEKGLVDLILIELINERGKETQVVITPWALSAIIELAGAPYAPDVQKEWLDLRKFSLAATPAAGGVH